MNLLLSGNMRTIKFIKSIGSKIYFIIFGETKYSVMNKLILKLLLIVSPFRFNAQTDCVQSVFKSKISPNNVNYTIIPNGAIIDYNNNYQIVQNGCEPIIGKPTSCPMSIFSSGIWAGGLDENSEVKLAATEYYLLNDDFDWYAGPLDSNGEPFECSDWDKVFQINKDDLIPLLTNYENGQFNGLDCSQLTDNVKYWPGKGNPYWNEKFDFDLPNQELATFFDYDKNGIYDPCKGDLPSLNFILVSSLSIKPDIIINSFPNQVAFCIINDNGGPHKLSGGDNIKLELHMYAYGFKGEGSINNTSFVNVRSFYKGAVNLEDFYFGIYTDVDLGCYNDDYVGTDEENEFTYFYNMDTLDGTNGDKCVNGAVTFGSEIPLIGIQLLSGVKNDGNENTGFTSSVILNLAGIGNAEPATTNPFNYVSMYNVLRGNWRTDEPLTYGGTGYNLGSIDTVKHLFTDPPNDENGWSMCTANLSIGDRRVLQSTGGIKLRPGDIKEFTFAYIYQPISQLPCPDISELQFIAKETKLFHDNNYLITSTNETYFTQKFINISSKINEFTIIGLKGNVDVLIRDVNGKNIQSFDVDLSEFAWKAPDYYSNGMYIVQIKSKTGSKATFKQMVLR